MKPGLVLKGDEERNVLPPKYNRNVYKRLLIIINTMKRQINKLKRQLRLIKELVLMKRSLKERNFEVYF